MLGMESSFFALGASYGLVGLLSVGRAGRPVPRAARSPLALAVRGAVRRRDGVLPVRDHGERLPAHFDRALGREARDGGRRGARGSDRDHRLSRGRSSTESRSTTSCSRTASRCRRRPPSGGATSVSTSSGRWRLRPDPKRALVISCGAGSTAKGLVETRSLEHIDVVDISRAILELSDLVYPDPDEHPLNDPRVHVHIEDGRYFLQATEGRYDIITGRSAASEERRRGEPLHPGVLPAHLRSAERGRHRDLLAPRPQHPGVGHQGDHPRLLRGLRGLQPVGGVRHRLDAGRFAQRAVGALGGRLRPPVAGSGAGEGASGDRNREARADGGDVHGGRGTAPRARRRHAAAHGQLPETAQQRTPHAAEARGSRIAPG